jgi:hypothetical protein
MKGEQERPTVDAAIVGAIILRNVTDRLKAGPR